MRKNGFIICLIVAVSVFFLSACSEKKEKKKTKISYYPKEYSISFELKSNENFSDSLIVANLDSSIYSPKITRSVKKKNRFIVSIDSFSTYDAAWMQGFHFSEYFKLKDFGVFKKGKKIKDKFRIFYFVGLYLDRAALYSIDLFTRKTNLVWSRWGKPILNLFRQEGGGNIYFTAAQKLSRSGGFSSIRRAQLFLFEKEKLSVRRIAYYGNGMQLKAGWISPNLFNAQFLLLDSLTNVDVIKQTYDYDASGVLLDTLVERIDLMSISFQEKRPELKFESDSKKIKMIFREQNDSVIVSTADFSEGIKTDVFKFRGEIVSTEWSGDGNYFLMMTIDSAAVAADSARSSVRALFVVNLRNHKLQTVISGNLDDYMLHGKILVYDKWIEGEKALSFYDLMKSKEIITLRFEGGCGINSILNMNNL